jgi:hypothetical protein
VTEAHLETASRLEFSTRPFRRFLESILVGLALLAAMMAGKLL